MVARDEIISFCDSLLDIGSFDDYGPNGLQVPGRAEVSHVATAVSAHLESIRAAVQLGADMLITHHGLFWSFLPQALTESMAERLRTALSAELSVAGYHLPLDAHPEVGNNAMLCRLLGFAPAEGPGPLGVVKGRAIGAVGLNPSGVPREELVSLVSTELGREPLVFPDGPEVVRSLVVVTGAGAGDVHDAIRLGLDAYLTGEPAEHVMADAREGRINFIAAGHYATEVIGIRRLGEMVGERFGVRHDFIEVPNPV